MPTTNTSEEVIIGSTSSWAAGLIRMGWQITGLAASVRCKMENGRCAMVLSSHCQEKKEKKREKERERRQRAY